jgi:hypothetical protein
MTAKKVNTPVYKMVSRTIDNSTHYPFVYLVLPAHSRIRLNNGRNFSQQFKVGLFEEEKLCPSYFTQFNSGLGCFYTNKMYHLRVHKLDWKLNAALRILKIVYPKKYCTIPGRNENIFSATLYNQSIENINGINEVLRHIESKGLSQLMVCCQRDDAIYRSLKKYAISIYDYTLKADFKIDSSDRVGIDVRCL